MRFRTAETTRDRRRAGRLVRWLATMLGVFLVAVVAVPQAQASSGFDSVMANSWTGRCADLPNYSSVPVNTPVTQFDCNLSITRDNQVWHFIPAGTYQGLTLYEIQNVKSGLCLDLPNYGSNPPGTHVSVYTCAPNQTIDNQQWFLVDQGLNNSDGYYSYEVVNLASNLCLDVANWASDFSDWDNGLPLTIYNCYNPAWANGGFDDHLWEFPGYSA